LKYEVILSDGAWKDVKRLERKDYERIFIKLNAIKEDPLHFLERLEGLKLWKLRVGDFRILCAVDVKKRKIFVNMICHRKNIYKRMFYQKYDFV